MTGDPGSDGDRRPRRIFAMGGGGFTMEPDNPLLDQYVAGLAGEPHPRICLLPTASGDDDDQWVAFHGAFGHLHAELTRLSLFRLGRRPVDVRDTLLSQDVLYVSGGSMRNMLAIWRVHGLDGILREAHDAGIVLAGLSAGSMCWFAHGITKSRGAPAPAVGLGLLDGSNCVHYDGEPDRRPAYHAALLDGMPAGYGVDDGAGLLFEDGQLKEAVGSRPDARAYRVEVRGGEVVETPLDVRMLEPGDDGIAEQPPEVSELREHRAALEARHARSASPGRWRR